MSPTDFGALPPHRAEYWAQQLLENAQRSAMGELLMEHANEERWHRSACRRNAMVRLFLARWGAFDAMCELRDPPFQTVGRVRIGRRWRDKAIP